MALFFFFVFFFDKLLISIEAGHFLKKTVISNSLYLICILLHWCFINLPCNRYRISSQFLNCSGHTRNVAQLLEPIKTFKRVASKPRMVTSAIVLKKKKQVLNYYLLINKLLCYTSLSSSNALGKMSGFKNSLCKCETAEKNILPKKIG